MHGLIKVSIAAASIATFIAVFVYPVFAAWTTDGCKMFSPSNGQNTSRGQNFDVVIEVCTSGSGGGFINHDQYAKYCSGTTCTPLTSISIAAGGNPMNTTTNPQQCSTGQANCKGNCYNHTFGITANNDGQFVIGGQCVGNGNLSSNRRNITINSLLTANAIFLGRGALNTTVINDTTDCAPSNPTCSHAIFNGTCTVADGASTIRLYVQDNSTGVWANTTGAAGAFIYTNRTVYNITSLSGTSGNMLFNITVTNKTARYSLRIQCNGPNAEPSWANSTVQTNMTVKLPGSSDSCTLTENEDWLLIADDNCALNNVAFNVKKINATGTGYFFCAKCNLTYTMLNLVTTVRFVFNKSFIFAGSVA